ncbi:MAG: hypothetical protein JNL04_07575 [Rhodospirillaceae bacterium]|nr:hypothetical protein [Rhodospirillaceae bacterium]
MASSISSVSLVPINAVALRPAPLRPVDAGVPAGLDPEALRQSQAFQAERREQERTRSADSERAGADAGRREAFTGDNAAFVTQLLNQDQASPKRPSFADAARAYGRFQEEPRTGFVIDLPSRVDVKV